jgi:hypothetical protein
MDKAQLLELPEVKELLHIAFREGYQKGKEAVLANVPALLGDMADALKRDLEVTQSPDGQYYMGGRRIS